ncbi:hypothetical protein [Nocardiopsis sp. CA-288880]|uniref:hypothetical protein n=1 Tax=Nocardiopsis sp. CA-288880 TaxID=3239995 RepID=UPI003D951958
MILSILATVAVLAAIAVIAAALALAETVLVYIALGLAGASVLLLLGGMVQGRIAESRTGHPGTDGLGKSSVPTGAAIPAATAAGPHVVPEYSGRVPVPAQGPVREAPAQDTPVWAAADDAGHGEPEYDVPRWQTPTAHEWPEPDTAVTAPAGSTFHAGSPAEAGPAPASEARTDGEPVDTAVTADIPEARERAGEDGEAPSRLHTGDDGPERDPAPFTYSIPGRGSSHEDGADPADATADPDDGVAGAGAPETDAFSYRIPGEADRTERAQDAPEPGDPDTAQAPAPDSSADGDGEARPDTDAVPRAEQAVEHAEAGSARGEDEPATDGDAGPGPTADGEDPEPDTDDTAAQGEREHASSEAEPVPSAHTDTDTDTDTSVSAEAHAPESEDADAGPGQEDGGRVEDAPAAGTGGAAEDADTGDPAPEAGSADDADGAFSYRLPGRGAASDEGADEAESDRETADTGRTSAFGYRLPQPEDGGADAERSDQDGEDDEEVAPAADGTADAGDPDTAPAPARPEAEGDAADGPGDGTGDAEPDGSERPARAGDAEEAEDDHAVAYAAVLEGDTDLDGDKDSDKDSDKVH